MKIAVENQEILKRIENKKSSYNIKNWQKNRETAEKYLANISEFPIKNSSEFDRKQIKTEHFNKRTEKWCFNPNPDKMRENESFYKKRNNSLIKCYI